MAEPGSDIEALYEKAIEAHKEVGRTQAAYDAAADDKARVKLSAEVRLLEGSIGRLLKLINTTPVIKSPPPPQNIYDRQASRHGRKAAESRWRRAGAV